MIAVLVVGDLVGGCQFDAVQLCCVEVCLCCVCVERCVVVSVLLCV